MDQLNNEIEKMMEPTSWPIPLDLIPRLREIKVRKMKITEQLDKLILKLKILESQRDLAHTELWEAIHEGMPAVPVDSSLSMLWEEKKIVLRKDGGKLDMLKKLFNALGE